MAVGITGGTELRYVAGRLRKAAARDLSRELRTAQRAAVRPLQKKIKASAEVMLPTRGGYAAIMAKAVKVSIGVGLKQGTLTARVYARGKVEHRDVVAINAGRLRHPLPGNRKKWKTTNVRPGFVDVPFNEVADDLLDESADAVQRVVTSIARS